jgi:hypothetical protein
MRNYKRMVKFETAVLVARSANISIEQAKLNFDKFIDESKISSNPLLNCLPERPSKPSQAMAKSGVIFSSLMTSIGKTMLSRKLSIAATFCLCQKFCAHGFKTSSC